MAESDVVP